MQILEKQIHTPGTVLLSLLPYWVHGHASEQVVTVDVLLLLNYIQAELDKGGAPDLSAVYGVAEHVPWLLGSPSREVGTASAFGCPYVNAPSSLKESIGKAFPIMMTAAWLHCTVLRSHLGHSSAVGINSIVDVVLQHCLQSYATGQPTETVCCDLVCLQVQGLGKEILIHTVLHHWQMLEVRAAPSAESNDPMLGCRLQFLMGCRSNIMDGYSIE